LVIYDLIIALAIIHPKQEQRVEWLAINAPAATLRPLLHFIIYLQESIGGVARQYKQNKRASLREKYKVSQALQDRLKRILEDVRSSFLLKASLDLINSFLSAPTWNPRRISLDNQR
jgi:hypothetical protein